MNKNSKIFIAGAAGMVGSAIIKTLLSKGYRNLSGSWHSRMPHPDIYQPFSRPNDLPKGLKLFQMDLTVQDQVNAFFKREKPEYVFLAAAKVGGIYANNTYPADFIHANLTLQGNIIHCAYSAGARRLLFLGSSCIYPKNAPQPMNEGHLLTGLLEPTNEPYAIAKIAGIKMCEAYNRQFGTQFMAVMPTNLFGPNDNFDLETSHVLPALIRKFHDAKIGQKDTVTVWGTGTPKREFLHVDDMADAAVFVMNLDSRTASRQFFAYPEPCFVNIGSGVDCTIQELAQTIQNVVGFNGAIEFDTSKPDGTPQKLLDVSRMNALGWQAGIDLKAGIEQTYQWYLEYLERTA